MPPRDVVWARRSSRLRTTQARPAGLDEGSESDDDSQESTDSLAEWVAAVPDAPDDELAAAAADIVGPRPS